MLPSSFEYHRPATLDEALDLLASLGDDAKVLAGGQSLIPMMKLRFAAPGHLVDINRIAGLDAHRGARRRAARSARWCGTTSSPGRTLIDRRYPTIAAAAPQIADPLVRNLGHDRRLARPRDPERRLGVGDARGGRERGRCKSTDGEREVPDRPSSSPTRSRRSIAPNEMLTEIRVPSPTGGCGGTYLKLERKVGDYATVAVGDHG